MSDTKWHSGPPPSVGWWPASFSKDEKALRWWDGERWSMSTNQSCRVEHAVCMARIPLAEMAQSAVKWRARPKSWPARSRT